VAAYNSGACIVEQTWFGLGDFLRSRWAVRIVPPLRCLGKCHGLCQGCPVEDVADPVAHARHDVTNGACRLVVAVDAAAVEQLADARDERERAVGRPDDIAERYLVRRAGKAIAAGLTPQAFDQPRPLEVSQDGLEKLSRNAFVRRDGRNLPWRIARRDMRQVD